MLLLALACSAAPGPAPADPERLARALGLDRIPHEVLPERHGARQPSGRGTVEAVSLEVVPNFRVGGLLWRPPGEGPFPGVLVAHGHFGEGKSSAESQDPAHALRDNGYLVLAVDTPGVEEGDRPGRRIHLEGGVHGRGLLWAAGSSPMALQLRALQAGLDLLEAEGASSLAVTGASGGAVQAFYLLFIDPRPLGAALASYVPMPHEARAAGCTCDVLPGWPGPDPALEAAAPRPVLWMSEVERPPPASGTFAILPGPHGYSREMVGEMLDFFEEILGGGASLPSATEAPEHLEGLDLGHLDIADLFAEGPPVPAPRLDRTAPWEMRCQGRGPTLVIAGPTSIPDGVRTCVVELLPDEAAEAEAVTGGRVWADSVSAALVAAVKKSGAKGIVAAGAWAVPASRTGLPYAVQAPVTDPEALGEGDPGWVHVPGWWWAGERYAEAVPLESLLTTTTATPAGAPPPGPEN